MRETDRERGAWRVKFHEAAQRVHQRKLSVVADRILKRIDRTYHGLRARSKKYGVPCTVEREHLRNMIFEGYGRPCPYCQRRLTLQNFVIDHRIPMSKGGPSTPENLQMICSVSNGIKGSLAEAHFLTLMKWLNEQPEELRKDVTTRLARGIC